ncbi:MAG: phosphate acetyltransferase [Clostridiales bacterium]|nr:phosphate acetyltransferase [Clostridiales bacterium]
MSLLQQIIEKAKSNKKHVLLPEGGERRTLLAAARIHAEGIARVTLLGNADVIRTNALTAGADIAGIEIVDPTTDPRHEAFSNAFYEMRKDKGVSKEGACATLRDPMFFAAMLVKQGYADGFVSGAVHTTGDTLRPGLQIIKTAPGVKTVSGAFIMEFADTNLGDNGLLIFADCAVNPDPDARQLAEIAISSAQTAQSLCGLTPRVAMLSFSTKGSAKHANVDKVREATRIARELAPELMLDGELQADAALVPDVGQLKSPGSTTAGYANVLVFPDLQAGNIGYKLVQRLAGAAAVGPICQGFAAPVNDLSRGCSVEDIVHLVAITAVQGQR